MQLGFQVRGAHRWKPLAVFGNQDSSQGAATNQATWYVSNLQHLPSRIIIQSLSDQLIYRIHDLEVLP